MLSPQEKEHLEKSASLDPNRRANLHYRVANKIKKKLSDLDDVNRALCSIPEKNARRVLDDEMVADIFRLTENMIRILGYVPIDKTPDGKAFVIRPEEILYKDANMQKVIVSREAPTEEDAARHRLLSEHIANLKKFANPEIPSNIVPKGTFYDLPIAFNDSDPFTGYNLCRKWQRRI
jgi:hypothetical protein